MFIFKEHDLKGYFKDEVVKPWGVEAKEKNEKDMVKAKRIIDDSIKDHLIPQVSPKNIWYH